MIPAQNVVAWGSLVPWTDARQIEQDLIISRALVEIFSDPMLREALRFRGGTAFSREEMLATKLRALLQRNKGRYLYDLAHALQVFAGLDANRVVEMFRRYVALDGQAISRAQAQERMFAKLANPRFLRDVRPLLPGARAETLTEGSTAEAFRRVFMTLVDRFPGEPWGRTAAMKQKFGISW